MNTKYLRLVSGSRRARAVLAVGSLILIAMLPQAVGQEATSARVILSQGKVRYVAPLFAPTLQSSSQSFKASAVDSTNVALERYAGYFGFKNPAVQLQILSSESLGAAGDVVRLRQKYNGVPVIAGDMVMTLSGSGEMRSLTGRVDSDIAVADTTPRVSAGDARLTAALATAKHNGVQIVQLEAKQELAIFDSSLLGPADGQPAALVWKVEVNSVEATMLISQFVLVDAISGGIILNFSQVETARNRRTHNATNAAIIPTPGTLVCIETQPLCTNGVNVDADLAHLFAAQTYDFYQTRFNRVLTRPGVRVPSKSWSALAWSMPTTCWRMSGRMH
jgi:Zn-dependent metalloprotease